MDFLADFCQDTRMAVEHDNEPRETKRRRVFPRNEKVDGRVLQCLWIHGRVLVEQQRQEIRGGLRRRSLYGFDDHGPDHILHETQIVPKPFFRPEVARAPEFPQPRGGLKAVLDRPKGTVERMARVVRDIATQLIEVDSKANARKDVARELAQQRLHTHDVISCTPVGQDVSKLLGLVSQDGLHDRPKVFHGKEMTRGSPLALPRVAIDVEEPVPEDIERQVGDGPPFLKHVELIHKDIVEVVRHGEHDPRRLKQEAQEPRTSVAGVRLLIDPIAQAMTMEEHDVQGIAEEREGRRGPIEGLHAGIGQWEW